MTTPITTVEDVFLQCLPSTMTQQVPAGRILQAVKAWLAQQGVLSLTTADDFFAQADTIHWGDSPEFLTYWVAFVSAKFLKFSASEYAYLHKPANAATAWLTTKTAQLVSLDHLRAAFQSELQRLSVTDATLPWRWSSDVDTVAILHALLFVLIFYQRPAIAVRILEPVFLAIVREQEENFTIVPLLLSYFLSHMSFQDIKLHDRIALLADQLVKRGFVFATGFTVISADGGTRVVEMAPRKVEEVLRTVRALGPAAEVRIHSRIDHDDGECDEAENLTLSKYMSAVVGACQHYYERCKQVSKKQRKGGATLLKLMPTDVMLVMKELHRMLRFGDPYSDRFQRRGLWRDILNSEGWLPLQVIDEQLSQLPQSVLKDMPSKERLEIVESLLRQHDNFQRYQVGYCSLRGSAFHGQRCARSIYGHALETPLLYRQIICKPECLLQATDESSLASLPLYGWVALDKSPRKSLGAHPSLLSRYDNIPFIIVMPAEAIGAFREYDETIEAEKKYDEKLRKPCVYFAEVYLRALARDGDAFVLEGDEGGPNAVSSLTAASMGQDGPTRTESGSSVVSSLGSGKQPSRHRQRAATAAAPSATGTEVYLKTQDEADARTQRWYVFPQYFVKKMPKATAPPPPALQDGEEAQPMLNAIDTTTASTATATATAAVVSRRPPRGAHNLGLPKLFFTGRVAELRVRKLTEPSRHEEMDAVVTGKGNSNTPENHIEDTSAEDDTKKSVNGDGDSDGDEAEQRSRSYRNTAWEFDPPALADSGDDSLSGDDATTKPAALCEYKIEANFVVSDVVPRVVVRRLQQPPVIGVDAPVREREVMCLSPHDPASAFYQNSFPPSRMHVIFRDYLQDPLIKVVTEADDDQHNSANTSVVGGSTVSAKAGSGGNQDATSSKSSAVDKAVTAAAAAAAGLPPTAEDMTVDAAAWKAALEQFILSDQVVCVLMVRIMTEAGVPLPGCRQSIDELKLFARERSLTYVTVGKVASARLGGDQRGKDGEADSIAPAYTLGSGSGSGSDGSPFPSPVASNTNNKSLRIAFGASAASPTSTFTLPGESGGEGKGEIRDLEVLEFRKRVTWRATDLAHILSELQLTIAEVPLPLLASALTRECEDRTTNYELLEFIGDAVMDFLVAADACVLANAAYRRALLLQPTPQAEKWTPQASRMPLPRHCWVGDAPGTTAVMMDSVTSVLCCNAVIAELLPPTVARHFSEEHYPNLAHKVRADVFEAMIGAAYRSGVGMDRLRLLLRRLFSFLPAAVRAADAAGAACVTKLMGALQMCPYLLEEDALTVETVFRYRTTELFEMTPGLLETDATAAAKEREAGVNTHLVSSRLPRIQAKEFATIFTTGTAYAYRRLFSFDAVRVHNRILHLFSENSIGFLNEIFTDIIHLVLDIDKVALMSWGLLPILWEWYTTRYSCHAGVFALDCSGRTMVEKERVWKDSCHIHFPQITVGVATWNRLVSDIRDTVVSALADKEAHLRELFTAHVHDYGVWLRRSALLKAVRAAGGEPRPHLWTYCDAEALLQLSRTSRTVRQSVLEHVAYVTRDLPAMAAFAGVESSADIFIGDANKAEELVVVEHRRSRRRLILPLHWIDACREDPPLPVFKPQEKWDKIIDQELTESRKLRLYLNDKCDTIYGVERRPLVLDTLLIAATPPPSAATNVTSPLPCVTYRPQRFDRNPVEKSDLFCLHRARQSAIRRERHGMRRLPLREHSAGGKHTMVTNTSYLEEERADIIEPLVWDRNEFGDDLSDGWVVECAHRSTLTLSSLRSSEYRGTDRKVYASWVDCQPLIALSSAEGEEGTAAAAAATATPLLALEGSDDVLPTFDAIYEHRADLPGQLDDFDWMRWFNFFKMRVRDYVFKNDNTQSIRVWSPAWWAFDSRERTTTFYIATEPVLRLHNTPTLAAALSPPSQTVAAVSGASNSSGTGGLERVAQLFMPQISTVNKAPIKVKEPHVYLLFPDKTDSVASAALKGGGSLPPPPLSSAPPPPPPPQQQQQQQQQKMTEVVASKASPASVVAGSPVSLNSPSSPRSTSNIVRKVLSLTPWIETQAGEPLLPSAWLRRAIELVYTASVARSELGSVPLVVCDSAKTFAEVTADCQIHTANPSYQLLRALPLVLIFSDTGVVADLVKQITSRPNRTTLHIFVVGDVTSESQGEASLPGRLSFLKSIQTFDKLLADVPKGSPLQRRRYYVRTKVELTSIESAFNPLSRVI